MQYIVLDMEWNQAWPGSAAARRLETPIHGEIIQIGAVRVSAEREVRDEFQILIRPKYIRKLNSKVSKLTGIKEAVLKEQGVEFPAAIEAFRRWIGGEFVFLTWGYDDIRILRENLLLYSMDSAWVEKWYNAQLIFNAQTDGGSMQKALLTALEIMGIEPTRPAHDALGDAYHTSLICARLDLEKGMREYSAAKEKQPKPQQSDLLPDCIGRQVFEGFADRADAIEAMTGEKNACPECGRQMTAQQWLSQPGSRYMTRATCKKHGGYLVRIRIQPQDDGTVRVGRLVYTGDSEAAKSYDRLIALREKPRRRRRRRNG
ncbi:MAG: exonuclease domain-containing protein [Oscillospiraceae bacterium]|nr:exonuclease domain-containing protein [Oscillospiraceae bacterium]